MNNNEANRQGSQADILRKGWQVAWPLAISAVLLLLDALLLQGVLARPAWSDAVKWSLMGLLLVLLVGVELLSISNILKGRPALYTWPVASVLLAYEFLFGQGGIPFQLPLLLSLLALSLASPLLNKAWTGKFGSLTYLILSPCVNIGSVINLYMPAITALTMGLFRL